MKNFGEKLIEMLEDDAKRERRLNTLSICYTVLNLGIIIISANLLLISFFMERAEKVQIILALLGAVLLHLVFALGAANDCKIIKLWEALEKKGNSEPMTGDGVPSGRI
ncbi:MAG: hypothetical protein VCA36_10680 [Opitutales bacterium]